MDMLAPLSGEATLEIVLENREKRVERQHALLKKHRLPLLSFTVNMPGAVKDNAAARLVFSEGVRLLDELFQNRGWNCPERMVTKGPAGPELAACIETDALSLKTAVAGLEEDFPLGRLFDMDVLDSDGNSISRVIIGLSPRSCLVCAAPAKECGRGRGHGLEAVLGKVREIVRPHINSK